MLDRLTVRLPDEPIYIPDENKWRIADEFGAKCLIGEVVDRLAAYEDIGLSPERIKQILDSRPLHRIEKGQIIVDKDAFNHCNELATAYSKIGTVNEFAELAKAKAEGRLAILPLKVGSTIEALQQENEWLKDENVSLRNWNACEEKLHNELIESDKRRIELELELEGAEDYREGLEAIIEKFKAQMSRIKELLLRADDEIEKYKCLWKGSKPGGCDCPKPTALQKEIEDAVAEIESGLLG